jgi:NAD(P)-dependent dehydrogenase (short-subunit alcohol dehydrogenase family)
MFDAATKALGPLTAVVANAGILAPTAKLTDMGVERMRHIFEVNVLGAFLTAREAARRLSKSSGGEGGSIVLMSSAAARLGSPNLYVDYAASKGAIDTLTLGLAKELGPEGVRVNAIRPGMIDTEIHASGGDPDRGRTLGAAAPLGRAGAAEEVAAGGEMAHQRRGVLCDRRAARCLGRTLSALLSKSPPKASLTNVPLTPAIPITH